MFDIGKYDQTVILNSCFLISRNDIYYYFRVLRHTITSVLMKMGSDIAPNEVAG